MKKMIPQEIEKIVGEFAQLCANGFASRWDFLPVELYISEAYEVVGGLMSVSYTHLTLPTILLV